MKNYKLVIFFLAFIILFSGCTLGTHTPSETMPEYSNEPFSIVNGNMPDFTQDDITLNAYERYSPLDWLGRCGVAMACLGKELMPTEARESISHIKPSGWQQAQYDFVDGKNLYNRCHLIGFQLSGENDNERNLITGTRYMNVEGMLPFENMVADYIKETGNHVLYRITPVFVGECLVAEGVRMEAMSVEDCGAGILLHVFIYNRQPGVIIDYKTGTSTPEKAESNEKTEQVYILNINSNKFHRTDCKQAKSISAENYKEVYSTRESLLQLNYIPAGCCKP